MDWFNFFLNNITIMVQGSLQLFFTSQFTGKKLTKVSLLVYFGLLYFGDWIVTKTQFYWLAIGLEFFILYEINNIKLKNNKKLSCVTAILAVYITKLSFGMINSLEFLFFQKVLPYGSLLYVFIILATFFALFISYRCYKLIIQYFSLAKGEHEALIWMLFPPVFFFFAVEIYILYTAYGQVLTIPYPLEIKKHIVLFLIQLLGLFALFSALYAYKRTYDGFQAETSLIILKQEEAVQKKYVKEAQRRYEKTKAFRHDIKNHLSVLEGFLKADKIEQAQNYLQKLVKVTSELSFCVYTGNPVVDILLQNKLELARENEVKTEISLLLPENCVVDDLDLCIIFANALDNAVNACLKVQGEKIISIIGEQQGDFYRLEFENTYRSETWKEMGTGLFNVQTVAEKYHGAITMERSTSTFCLNVLLNISVQPKNHS